MSETQGESDKAPTRNHEKSKSPPPPPPPPLPPPPPPMRTPLQLPKYKRPVGKPNQQQQQVAAAIYFQIPSKRSSTVTIDRISAGVTSDPFFVGFNSPTAVAIGPYYHGSPRLSEMEAAKCKALDDFCRMAGELPKEAVYEKILPLADGIRSCYVNGGDGKLEGMENDHLAKMMSLDGCFLLQFIDKVVPLWPDSSDEPRWSGDDLVNTRLGAIARDVLLMENQIPWVVLEALMDLGKVDSKKLVPMFLDGMATAFAVGGRHTSTACKKKWWWSWRREAEAQEVADEEGGRDNVPVPALAVEEEQQQKKAEAQELDEEGGRDNVPVPAPAEEQRVDEEAGRDVVPPMPTLAAAEELQQRKAEDQEVDLEGGRDNVPVPVPAPAEEQRVDEEGGRDNVSVPAPAPSPHHLLDLFHRHQLGKVRSQEAYLYILPSLSSTAVELAEMGVKLTASKTNKFGDMEMKKHLWWLLGLFGELSLAPLVLNSLTACWLLNIVAYEAFLGATQADNFAVSSYVFLVAHLVNREEDVQDLRARGIISSAMSDRETLRFFKSAAPSLHVGDRYIQISQRIQEYKQERWIWIAVHRFLYNNMKIIIGVLSVAGVLVGLFKTILSVKQPHLRQ